MAKITRRPPALSLLPAIPLPKLFPLITACILLLFITVLLAGVHQYSLYHQCSKAVITGDRLLFQFTAVRDSICDSIATDKVLDLAGLSTTLEAVTSTAGKLENNLLLPDALKRHLFTSRDLVGILSSMQSIQNGRQTAVAEKLKIIQRLNDLGNQLQQFRIGLSDQTQRILQGLHKTIIGILGLVIVASCSLLYYLNRTIGVPLLRLCNILENRETGNRASKPLFNMNELVDEVKALSDIQNNTRDMLLFLCRRPEHSLSRICSYLTFYPGILYAWIIQADATDGFHPMHNSAQQDNQEFPPLDLSVLTNGNSQFSPLTEILTQSLAEEQIIDRIIPSAGESKPEEQTRAVAIPIPSNRNPRLILLLQARSDVLLPWVSLRTPALIISLLNCPGIVSGVSESGSFTPPISSRNLNRLLFSASGAVGSETASALTNMINGSINHIQQLIDLNTTDSDKELTMSILHRMIREEKKAAGLINTLMPTLPGQTGVYTSKDLATLLESLVLILEKPLQAEAIELSLEVEPTIEGGVRADLFKLTTMYLVHLGRRSLNAHAPKSSASGGSIALHIGTFKDKEIRLSVEGTISPASWDMSALDDDPGWPSVSEYQELVKANNGSIFFDEEDNRHRITLLFPAVLSSAPNSNA